MKGIGCVPRAGLWQAKLRSRQLPRHARVSHT